jgi:aspartokinase/homoserine dehydrogenase 1
VRKYLLEYTKIFEGNERARAGLVGADRATKLGSMRTSDAVVIFTTKYYSDNPLAITGPGAGHALTASGVLGDVVSLSKEM